MKPFEIEPRGAEAALDARGRDLSALFQNAAMGLLTLFDRRGKVRDNETVSVRIYSSSAESMMVHWLSELVYLVQTRRWLYSKIEFTRLHENNLTAVLHGEPFKEGVHSINREIKAVTFSELAITRDKDVLKAHVVLDV